MLHAITCGGLYSLFSAAVFPAVVLTADKTPRDGALPIIENLGGAAMRGFVFDLDNTLFDRYGTIRTLMLNESERIIPYINVSYDIERAIEHVIHTEPLYILGGWEGVYEALCREHFFKAENTPKYEKVADFVRECFKKYAVPFPFTIRLLEDLRTAGYKLGIITNGDDKFQRRKIEMLGFGELFDEILTSGEFAEHMCGDERNYDYWKPNPRIFDEMARRLNIPADKLYYVGDNPLNDVRACRAAGYVPVWIKSLSPWPYSLEEMPEHSFDSIDGLRALI